MSEIKKILIVDDDISTLDLVAMILQNNNYFPIKAANGREAIKAIENYDIDGAILDMMLPDYSGLDLIKVIRDDQRISSIPVLMLTGKTDEIDTVLGLEIGADDYIHKPFKKRELLARLNAVFRRFYRDDTKKKILVYGDLIINPLEYWVKIKGREVRLSPKEFNLLLMLSARPGRIFTREEILDKVWGYDIALETRTVDVHVRKLRTKIEKDPGSPKYIETVKGIGYRFAG
ncbi:MAG: response regulator transcription factor [Firmicutes bacterium]|jgi:DNA-binding response OmpR family regulator|nr:response regulator transcription factor [Bacillota bacterium]